MLSPHVAQNLKTLNYSLVLRGFSIQEIINLVIMSFSREMSQLNGQMLSGYVLLDYTVLIEACFHIMKMYDKQNKPLPLRFLVFQQRISSSNKTSSHIKLMYFFPYFDTFIFLSKQKHNNLNFLLFKILTLFINLRNKWYQHPIF